MVTSSPSTFFFTHKDYNLYFFQLENQFFQYLLLNKLSFHLMLKVLHIGSPHLPFDSVH
jgi:hypothetical protein